MQLDSNILKDVDKQLPVPRMIRLQSFRNHGVHTSHMPPPNHHAPLCRLDENHPPVPIRNRALHQPLTYQQFYTLRNSTGCTTNQPRKLLQHDTFRLAQEHLQNGLPGGKHRRRSPAIGKRQMQHRIRHPPQQLPRLTFMTVHRILQAKQTPRSVAAVVLYSWNELRPYRFFRGKDRGTGPRRNLT